MNGVAQDLMHDQNRYEGQEEFLAVHLTAHSLSSHEMNPVS